MSSVLDFLNQDRPAWLRYGFALFLGMAFGYWLFGPEFIFGQSAFFQSGDTAQSLSGWYAFRNSPWTWPILQTAVLNHPSGANVAFTDSIPLAALPFKLLRTVLSPDFHYFGWWYLGVYGLQAISATYLLEKLRIKSLFATVTACAFALTFPVLGWRLGHTALMTQGLLILGLAFYIAIVDRQLVSRRVHLLGFIVLIQAGLLIHPYFLAMLMPLYFCSLFEAWRRGLISLTRAFAWLLSALLISLAILKGFGYLSNGSTDAGGYDFFSFNLAAPFCGGSLCTFVDGTGGQYEGYAYLGLGLLLVLLVAVVTRPGEAWRLVRSHGWLVLLMAGFTVYAMSNKIVWQHHILIHLPPVAVLDHLTGTFRTAGRFIWPAIYGLLFAGLYLLLKRRDALAVLVVTAGVVIQLYDVRAVQATVWEKAHLPGHSLEKPWLAAFQQAKGLYLFPAYGCGKVKDDSILKYQYRAAYSGTPINTGYMARANMDCAAKLQELEQAITGDNLLVMPAFAGEIFATPPIFLAAMQQDQCVVFEHDLICSRSKALLDSLPGAVSPSALRYSHTWTGASFSSLIGVPDGNALRTRTPDAQGFLAFGPYIELYPGNYRLRIDVSTTRPYPAADVGSWDVAGIAPDGQRVALATGNIAAGQKVITAFEVTKPLQRVEFRVIANGVQELRVQQITLEKDR